MAQFALPDADLSVGNWEDQAAGTTNIFQSIDETVASASDADYVQSEAAPSASPYVCGLSNVTDPASSSGHIMRWRRAKSGSGATLNLTVQLRQGYVSEGTPGTQIASQADNDIPATFTDTSYTLSAGEADSITDYTALALRFVATQV